MALDLFTFKGNMEQDYGDLDLFGDTEVKDEEAESSTLKKRKAVNGIQKLVSASQTAGKGKKGDGDAETVTVSAKLFTQVCSLVVKHDWGLKAFEREQNLCIRGLDDHPVMKAMAHYLKSYDATAKSKPVPDGFKEYQGHPEGVRPNAMMRHLFLRLAQILGLGIISVQHTGNTTISRQDFHHWFF